MRSRDPVDSFGFLLLFILISPLFLNETPFVSVCNCCVINLHMFVIEICRLEVTRYQDGNKSCEDKCKEPCRYVRPDFVSIWTLIVARYTLLMLIVVDFLFLLSLSFWVLNCYSFQIRITHINYFYKCNINENAVVFNPLCLYVEKK